MKRGVRIILLALLVALLAGFIAGTVIRMRFERPVQYLGFQKGVWHQTLETRVSKV